MPSPFPLIFSVAAIVRVAIVAALIAGNPVQECRWHRARGTGRAAAVAIGRSLKRRDQGGAA